MTKDERQVVLLLRAGEFDESVKLLDEALAENARRREAARAEGQDDLARFDACERRLTAHRDDARGSAEAFAREARGEPCPMTWACERATLPAAG